MKQSSRVFCFSTYDRYSFWPFFPALWLVLLALYFPAAEAGQVGDYPGLSADWKHYNFTDYLNRRWSYLAGMYQLTQLVTWLWFYLFDTAPWPWHLLQLSLHAASAYLLGRLLFNILCDAGFKEKAIPTSLLASMLFAVWPNAAESVIWEPAYHYPQALTLQLLILLCVRKYLITASVRWAGFTVFLFLLSTFTLEYFYLTPCFTMLLIALYKPFAARNVRQSKAALRLLLPQALMMCLYFFLMTLTYGQAVPRAGGSEYFAQPGVWFINPVKNALSLLLHARAWPGEWRSAAYQFFDSPVGAALSWVLFASIAAILLFVFGKKQALGRVATFFASMCLLSLWLSGPLQFERVFRHNGDRYLYSAAAFWSSILAVWLIQMKPAMLRRLVISAILLLNGFLAIQTISDWRKSASIVRRLQGSLPSRPGKIVMLLNVPQVYKGIPMFAVGRESEFAIRRRQFALQGVNTADSIIEVAGYPMMAEDDGVDAVFESDSVLRITLQDWGRWWMRGNLGAGDYEHELYNVKEMGSSHHYLLCLKKRATKLVFYRQDGGRWYEVKQERSQTPHP